MLGIVVLLGLIVIGVYAGSLVLNPWVKCSKCQGKQKAQGWIFNRAHHSCSKCGGSGREERWGHKVFVKHKP